MHLNRCLDSCRGYNKTPPHCLGCNKKPNVDVDGQFARWGSLCMACRGPREGEGHFMYKPVIADVHAHLHGFPIALSGLVHEYIQGRPPLPIVEIYMNKELIANHEYFEERDFNEWWCHQQWVEQMHSIRGVQLVCHHEPSKSGSFRNPRIYLDMRWFAFP
jgi:hypothetical protein